MCSRYFKLQEAVYLILDPFLVEEGSFDDNYGHALIREPHVDVPPDRITWLKFEFVNPYSVPPLGKVEGERWGDENNAHTASPI